MSLCVFHGRVLLRPAVWLVSRQLQSPQIPSAAPVRGDGAEQHEGLIAQWGEEPSRNMGPGFLANWHCLRTRAICATLPVNHPDMQSSPRRGGADGIHGQDTNGWRASAVPKGHDTTGQSNGPRPLIAVISREAQRKKNNGVLVVVAVASSPAFPPRRLPILLAPLGGPAVARRRHP